MAAEAAAHLRQDLFRRAQADLVALHLAGIGADGVADADVQRPVLGQGRDGHRLRRVGIFADVGKEIVEHPLEIRHIHAHPAERVGHDHPRGKTRALQLRLRLAEQLLQQDVGVIRLQPHRQLIVRKQQAVSEQLIRQLLDAPRALLTGGEIARRVGRQIALRGDDVEITEQGRERIADVVREGGDEVGVLLEGLLLLLGLVQERGAHPLDALGQARQLVITAGLFKPRGQIAAADLLDLRRDRHDRARDAAVVAEHEAHQHETADEHAHDRHQCIEPRFGKVVDHGLHRPVGEVDGIDARGIGQERRCVRLVHIVHAPPAGLEGQPLVPVEHHIGIALAHRPAGHGVGITRGDAVFLHIGLQLADDGPLALLYGLLVEIDLLDQCVADPVRHEIGRRRARDRDQQHEQLLRPQRGKGRFFSQSDTPFPTRCGSGAAQRDCAPASFGGSRCGP